MASLRMSRTIDIDVEDDLGALTPETVESLKATVRAERVRAQGKALVRLVRGLIREMPEPRNWVLWNASVFPSLLPESVSSLVGNGFRLYEIATPVSLDARWHALAWGNADVERDVVPTLRLPKATVRELTADYF